MIVALIIGAAFLLSALNDAIDWLFGNAEATSIWTIPKLLLGMAAVVAYFDPFSLYF